MTNAVGAKTFEGNYRIDGEVFPSGKYTRKFVFIHNNETHTFSLFDHNSSSYDDTDRTRDLGPTRIVLMEDVTSSSLLSSITLPENGKVLYGLYTYVLMPSLRPM